MNDIEVLRINYDRDGWEKITEGWTKHNVVSGSILAINSLCDEVEILRQQLAEAQAKLAAVERDLAEAKKTLEWLYRWSGHKPLSECVRKVSDTLQAMREVE